MATCDRKRQEEWDTAVGVVSLSFIVSVPVFFLLMSAREATQATAIFLSACVLIMGTGSLIFKPKRSAKVKQERVVLTEAEFEFLASGVKDMGYIDARHDTIDSRYSDCSAFALGDSLVAKGLLEPTGVLPADHDIYRLWRMTSKGIDVALAADFTPAPGWYPFGNPDQREN